MANERGRLYDSDTATTVLLHDTSGKIKIIDEEIDIQTGITKKPFPLTKSSRAVVVGLFGRSRVITLQGVKFGTQAQIETFINTIEAWVNADGFQAGWRYYPLFGAANTLAASNLQNAYYDVMPDSFNRRVSLRDVGYVCQWTLTMVEGILE